MVILFVLAHSHLVFASESGFIDAEVSKFTNYRNEFTVRFAYKSASKHAFYVRPVGLLSNLQYADAAMWKGFSGVWAKNPITEGLITLRYNGVQSFLEISFELLDVRNGRIFTTPKRKIYTGNAFWAYLGLLNKSIESRRVKITQ